jgi:hypothetical protein
METFGIYWLEQLLVKQICPSKPESYGDKDWLNSVSKKLFRQ